MSTYAARHGSGIVHAVYDHEEIYETYRAPEAGTVCCLVANLMIPTLELVSCLWCLATMNTTEWWSMNSDPDQSIEERMYRDGLGD